MVHVSSAGNILVLGVLLEESASAIQNTNNSFLNQFWQHGAYIDVDGFSTTPLNPYTSFLPASRSFYTYTGSLTTPPYARKVLPGSSLVNNRFASPELTSILFAILWPRLLLLLSVLLVMIIAPFKRLMEGQYVITLVRQPIHQLQCQFHHLLRVLLKDLLENLLKDLFKFMLI